MTSAGERGFALRGQAWTARQGMMSLGRIGFCWGARGVALRGSAAVLAVWWAGGLGLLEAAPAVKPPEELLLLELDKRRPDEHSPFFAQRERAEFFATEAGQQIADRNRVAVFPNTAKGDSVGQTLVAFWRDLSKPLRGSERQPVRKVTLSVRPGPDFSLDGRREITAVLELANTTKRLITLEFETTKRVDFVIEDDRGVEVVRWSRDREFVEMPGVVMVNPDERVTFTGTLPTRELQAGRVYTLRAEVAGHGEFTQAIRLRPRGGDSGEGMAPGGGMPLD